MPALLVSALLSTALSLTPQTEPREWGLATADTRVTLRQRGDQVVLARLESTRARRNWIAAEAPITLLPQVWNGDRAEDVSWRLEAVREDAGAGTVAFTLASTPPGLRAVSTWRARPGPGPVETWASIENHTGDAVTIGHHDSLALPALAVGPGAETWWIRRGGSNASTQGGVFRDPVLPGLSLDLVSSPEDGASPVPWLAVQEGESQGLYVGWEFSGLGGIRASVGDDGLLALGIGHRVDFRTSVAPGQTIEVPPAFVGCYSGDIDEGSYRLHRFVLEKLRPPVAPGIADPVLAYNLYLDAGGNQATEEAVLRCAELCRQMDFEVFVPDAMWFPQTGDWQWDPVRFPRGIGPVERAVHEGGMQLGLWCAWTNGGASERPGALSARGSQARPSWFQGDYGPDWQVGPFWGARLCLASDEACEWATAETHRLVREFRLDYLKHDISPIVTQCNKVGHRHTHGTDVSYRATLGYYRVMESLLARFPRLLLENCSGGGQIKDFGAMRRSHYVVTTDTLSNLPDRQSIYDSTFALPPLVLQAYTYDNAYPVEGDAPGTFLWRSAMMSAWQIDPTDATRWDAEQLACARRSAEIYKQWIRPLLADAKVHHILPRPDGVHWDGLFEFSPSKRKGTLFVFRPDSPDRVQTVRLRGLDPYGSYWVWCEDGSTAPGKRSGRALTGEGLAVDLPARYTSDLIYVQDAAVGPAPDLSPPGAFSLLPAETKADPFAASVKLCWTASPNARGYRLRVARNAEMAAPLVDTVLLRTEAVLDDLPAGERLWWRVSAISWGGRRDSETARLDLAPPPPLTGVTFLSDMEWAEATAGADNPVRRDRNYYSKALAIGGKRYPKGLWTHAFNDTTPADTVVSAEGRGFGQFVADVGLDDGSGPGSVQFQVLVDGRLVSESPVMTPRQIHRFSVPVRGARTVTLRVLNGGDGYACDHAVWGLARFVAEGAADPLGE